MGRKGKYAYEKSRKTIQDNKIVSISLVVISVLVYVFIIRNLITMLQWHLFSSSNTILIVPSSYLGLITEFIFGTVFIISMLLCIYFIADQFRISNNYGKHTNVYSRYIKIYALITVISFAIVSILFFSYCRADSNGLYIRDIRTTFTERRYSWNELSSVDINYQRGSKSGYTIQYLLNVDKFSVDIEDADYFTEKQYFDKSRKIIFNIIKENHVPVHKNIEKYDDEIKSFLQLINEQ